VRLICRLAVGRIEGGLGNENLVVHYLDVQIARCTVITLSTASLMALSSKRIAHENRDVLSADGGHGIEGPTWGASKLRAGELLLLID
jgi:hypothetical protein